MPQSARNSAAEQAWIDHLRKVVPDAGPGDPGFVLGLPRAGAPDEPEEPEEPKERGLAVVFDGPHADWNPSPADHTIHPREFHFGPRVTLARPAID